MKYVGLLIIGPIVVAAFAVLALLCGAAAGWIGGLIFPQVFTELSQLVFSKEIPAWQMGAMLGFIAGFLRAGVAGRRRV